MTIKAKIFRPITGPLTITTPYLAGNRKALNAILGPRTAVQHLGSGEWSIPRQYLHKATALLAERFGEVHVYTEHKASQRCDTRCVNAKGDECVCSCLGRNHKGGLHDWELNGTTLSREDVITAHYIVKGANR